jgi:predicted permease
VSWWKKVWRRRLQEAELDAELRFHIERLLQDYANAGLPAAEARRRVRLEFGELSVAKEECRDVRPLHWLDDLVRDVRLGFRGLGRDRLFAVSVTLILALGIGASVAMFSVLNAVVLRPLPYARPGELATLNTHYITQNQWDGTSVPNFLDWREQSKSFDALSCYRRTHVSQVTFAGSDAPQRAQEGLVGPGFFELIGAPPLLGRTFSREEFERRERLVVLSEGLWQEQFARSGDALGRTLSIGGENHVVIGVMPATFHLPTSDTRFWRPITILASWQDFAASDRDGDALEVIGRLASGVSIEDARAEMAVIATRLRDEHAANRNRDIRVVPLFDYVVGARTRQGVWLGFAAVLSLLAIACANVGGLLTARAARRRHELAVRTALGAGRSRLVRQLLAEGVSLWAIASVFGALLAYGSIRLLLAYGPRTLPRMEQVGLDTAGLAVAFLGGLAVVTLAGTIPALLAAKADARAAFGARGRASLRRHRFQDLLVTAQIAGALALLVGAVLFAQSFLRAQSEDPGYSAEKLLVVHIDRPSVRAFFREARDRIGGLPGVIAVGGIKQFFLQRNADQRVTIEGREAASKEAPPRLCIDAVTPGYFRSMGIELLEGRDFEDPDLEPGANVSIVNETMARRFWPGESALGKRWAGGESPPRDGRWSTVVGVVTDMRREGLDLGPIASAFLPDMFSRNFDMTIRAAANADNLIPVVRREIRSLDSSLAIPDIASAGGRLSERIGSRRFETQLLAVFAMIALLLSAAGLYASLAYQVALRTREIGIRSALGARRQSIVRMIVGKGIRLAFAGALLGVLGAAAAARGMQGLLYETSAVNPASYAGAAAFVLLVAAAAAWAPAQRAAAVSPMTILRDD